MVGWSADPGACPRWSLDVFLLYTLRHLAYPLTKTARRMHDDHILWRSGTTALIGQE